MKKKNTFWRDFLAFYLHYQRWKSDIRNIETVIRFDTMQRQINGFLFIFLAVIFASCSSVRKTEKNAVSATKTSDTRVLQSNEINSSLGLSSKGTVSSMGVAENNLTQTVDESGDYQATLTVYDTSKPVDSLTGKPPVQSELVIKKSDKRKKVTKNAARTANSTKQQSDININKKIEARNKTDSKAHTATKEKETTESTETTLPNKSLILFAVFGVGVLFLIIRFRVKIISRIVGFFRK